MKVVITGASKGLGRAVAEQFAGLGVQLFICARGLDALKETAASIQARFPQSTVNIQSVDLSSEAAVKNFGKWVMEDGKPVDVLVNNAGIFYPGSVHSEPEGSLDALLQVNLMSAYHLTRLLIPDMIKAKQGHVFNMCSIASLNAYANGGAYSISKFALYGFSKNLREEMKPHGIKVTHVLPGAAYSDSWSGSGVDPQRIMEADDVAKMIFAASQLSPQACIEEIVLRPQLGDL